MYFLKSSLIVTALTIALHGGQAYAEPQIKIDTSMGAITIDLNADRAPKTVANFLTYVESDFYTDTLFHRVIPKFMIQGGGFTSDMKKKPTTTTVINEARGGLSNVRGTISMARTNNPDSASAQFFINTVDNSIMLDPNSTESSYSAGYAVFGKVIAGMDVVDKIETTKTTQKQQYRDVPVENVVIKSISVLPTSK